MILEKLKNKKLISPPKWLVSNTQGLFIMGSEAYGVSSGKSDVDIYGWCIPPKKVLFPHLAGEIPGFGSQKKRFEQFQEHHINDSDAGKEYDISVYNIAKYFHLCMNGNPNMIDSLFVPDSCVLHSTPTYMKVRENRHLFLSKKMWHTFKGYAYSQLHKANSKQSQEGSKRDKLRKEFGMDTKYLYHVVRLMSEVEQVLSTGDLDLQEKGRREYMKAIRRGEVPEKEIRKYFKDKEATLEKLYHSSDLPYNPRESEIKSLLIECLEMHYQSISDAVVVENKYEVALEKIKGIIDDCL